MPAPANNLKVEQVLLDRLIPYALNARTHDDAQVAQIAASIREFGFNNPVLVDGDNGIIAGHGRVLAARLLELEKVPCIRLGHLSETQKKAFILADNRLALNAGWDEQTLALEIQALQEADVDVTALGFNAPEIEQLLAGVPDLVDGIAGGLPGEGADDAEPALADTSFTFGEYRFAVSREDYLRWQEELRQTVGFEKDTILAAIKERLKLCNSNQ